LNSLFFLIDRLFTPIKRLNSVLPSSSHAGKVPGIIFFLLSLVLCHVNIFGFICIYFQTSLFIGLLENVSNYTITRRTEHHKPPCTDTRPNTIQTTYCEGTRPPLGLAARF
jgi:hypothetical protein